MRGFECHTRHTTSLQPHHSPSPAIPPSTSPHPTPCQHFKRFKSRHHLLAPSGRSTLERKSRQRLKQCLTKHLRHSIIAPREVPHTVSGRRRARERGHSPTMAYKIVNRLQKEQISKYKHTYTYIYLYRKQRATERNLLSKLVASGMHCARARQKMYKRV